MTHTALTSRTVRRAFPRRDRTAPPAPAAILDRFDFLEPDPLDWRARPLQTELTMLGFMLLVR